jgi:hypothetical protein
MNYLKQKNDKQTEKSKVPLNLIIFIEIYLLFSIVFFFIGPTAWETRNALLTFTLVAIYQIMLYVGYKYGMRYPLKKRKLAICSDEYVIRHFKIIASFALVINSLYLLRITALISSAGLWNLVVSSVTSPSALYDAANAITISSSNMFGGKLLAIVIGFGGIITTAIVPLTIVYFKRFNVSTKLIAILSIFVQTLLSISTGRSEGFFTLGIYGLGAAILVKRKKKKSNLKVIIMIIIVIIALLAFYSNLMLDRTGGSYSLPLGENWVNTNVPLLKILPDNLEPLVVYLNIYLTQGYYGMSLATTCSWNPTFGFGSSAYLRENVESLLNIDLTTNSFLGQAQAFGWGASSNWHTVYTWLANDFSWPGVFVVMFLVGVIIAKIYRDAYINQNPVAIAMFSLLMLFVFFIPANNRVFAQAESFWAFWFYLIVWLIAPYIKTRNKYPI